MKSLRKSEMSLKLLKQFFDDYIDLIKVIFYQTLLVAIFLINDVKLVYATIAFLLFYAVIWKAKKFCYLPVLIVFLCISFVCNSVREHLSDKHYKQVLSESDGNGEFTLISDAFILLKYECDEGIEANGQNDRHYQSEGRRW